MPWRLFRTGDVSARDARFALAVASVYAVLLLACVLHHEMWRDEIQIWMQGRHIVSVNEFLRVMDAEPHPGVWYLIAAGLHHAFSAPEAIQYVHVVIATASAYVFLRHAPLARLPKALFVFGFFPFYEYGVISRGYALGIFCAFLVCMLWPTRNRRLAPISALLFAMANCSAFGLFMAVALAMTVGFGWISDRLGEGRWPVRAGQACGVMATVVVGAILSLIQIQTPFDSGLLTASSSGYFQFSVSDVVGLISRVYLYDFGRFPLLHGAAVSLLLGMAFAVVLSRAAHALFLYVCLTGIILTVVFVRQLGFLWHLGHLYYALVFGLWLAGHEVTRAGRPEQGPGAAGLVDRGAFWLVTALFVFQLAPAAEAAYKDYRRPYSCGKEAADFIKANALQEMPIAGDIYYALSTVSGYLERPVWYLTCGNDAVFAWWWSETILPRDVAVDEYARRVRRLASTDSRGVLLVLSYPLDERFSAHLGATLIRSFEDEQASFIQNEPAVGENYWLYIVRPPRDGAGR